MRYWTKGCLGFAPLGLTLFAASSILLACSRDYFWGKCTLFSGGLLISLTAMLLQVRVWRHHQKI